MLDKNILLENKYYLKSLKKIKLYILLALLACFTLISRSYSLFLIQVAKQAIVYKDWAVCGESRTYGSYEGKNCKILPIQTKHYYF